MSIEKVEVPLAVMVAKKGDEYLKINKEIFEISAKVAKLQEDSRSITADIAKILTPNFKDTMSLEWIDVVYLKELSAEALNLKCAQIDYNYRLKELYELKKDIDGLAE